MTTSHAHGTGYNSDLTDRFTYHPPEPEQPEVYEAVRDTAHLLAVLIESTTAPSREQSLAITHVEEAVFWANASIARRGLSGAGIAGAADLIEVAFQRILLARPESRLAGALSDTVPLGAVRGDEKQTVDPEPAEDPWATPEPPYTMLVAGLTAIAAIATDRGDHATASYAHTVLAGEKLPHPDTLLQPKNGPCRG